MSTQLVVIEQLWKLESVSTKMFPIKNILLIPNTLGVLLHNVKKSCAKLHSTSKMPYTWTAEKQYYEKGISQFMLLCQNSCTCNQTHQPHHPEKSQYLPNSSPQSESQLIRTMMINEVGLTTTGSELHFDSIISISQDTHAQYIENIWWHGDTWICIYFKGMWSHISRAGACACSSQDTHLFFVSIYVWEWARQYDCLVHP